MTTQQQIFERIEDYLHNRMTEEDRIVFEEQVAQDENLASLLAEAKVTNDAIMFASLAELKNTIGQDIKNIKYNTGWSGKAKVLSIFSALLVSALLGYFFLNKEKNEVVKTVIDEPVQMVQSDQRTEKIENDATTNNAVTEKLTTSAPSNAVSNTNRTNSYTSEKAESIMANTVKKEPQQMQNESSENKSTEAKEINGKTFSSPYKVAGEVCNKTFEIKTVATCENKQTGSISVITDKTKEYRFIVDDMTGPEFKGEFSNLSAGNHLLQVSYDKECVYSKVVTISEKWCPLNASYSFNPDYNEKWEINYKRGTEGTFRIYDKTGKEIYSSPFGSGNESWNGTDTQGNVVQLGTYFAIVNYSTGEKEKVELTIVR